MKILLKLFRLLLKTIYLPLRLLPRRNSRILFLSRQSNELTLDFRLISDELKKRDHEVELITICKRSSDSSADYVSFGLAMLKSMYYLATSRVCILDSYWPAVCMLNHKKGLTVIQIWHALGKIKQSGYQTVGRTSGRGDAVAKELCMHKNYDYIIAGGPAWNPYYCASFGTTEDRLVNTGLPRIDYLLAEENNNRERFFASYPHLRGRKIVLYAPTFRKGIQVNWSGLADNIDTDRFALVVKGHPNQPLDCDRPDIYTCDDFKAVDILAACDYLITDYSAIAVEGAILNRKTYYFLYDYEEYGEKNGTNINLFEEMPGCVFTDSQDLCNALSAEYPQEALDRYRQRFLPARLGSSTADIADLILDNM